MSKNNIFKRLEQRNKAHITRSSRISVCHLYTMYSCEISTNDHNCSNVLLVGNPFYSLGHIDAILYVSLLLKEVDEC